MGRTTQRTKSKSSKTKKTRPIRAVGVGLGLLALTGAAPAVAITPETSPAQAAPGPVAQTAEPAVPAHFLTLSDGYGDDLEPIAERRALQLAPAPPGLFLGGFRSRRIKVIHYATPIRVNQNEMMLNLDAPGAGRAIISLELKFY